MPQCFDCFLTEGTYYLISHHHITKDMLTTILLLSFVYIATNAAPTEGPTRIGLSLPDSPGFLRGAGERLSSLGGPALQNAAAINNLVSENLVTVSDTLHNGLASVSGIAKERLRATSTGKNSRSTNELANQASTAVYNTAAQGGKTLVDGAEILVEQKSNLFKPLTDGISNYRVGSGVFSNRQVKLENAVQEQEDFGSRLLSMKEGISKLFAGILQPKPVVDTITEEEKYGNNGDKFEGVGRALVSGSEKITNFVSQAANLPVDIFKSITRSASASLNNLGGRLVGLR